MKRKQREETFGEKERKEVEQVGSSSTYLGGILG
jgi:hypothetical protein